MSDDYGYVLHGFPEGTEFVHGFAPGTGTIACLLRTDHVHTRLDIPAPVLADLASVRDYFNERLDDLRARHRLALNAVVPFDSNCCAA